MNALLTLTAQTLIEHVQRRSEREVCDACDATLEFLKRQGCSPAVLRAFRRVLQRELRRRTTSVAALLVTPGGKSGAARLSLTSSLKRGLRSSVEFSEHADPSLLGGAVLTAGDERLDVSLRGALQDLSLHLCHPSL